MFFPFSFEENILSISFFSIMYVFFCTLQPIKYILLFFYHLLIENEIPVTVNKWVINDLLLKRTKRTMRQVKRYKNSVRHRWKTFEQNFKKIFTRSDKSKQEVITHKKMQYCCTDPHEVQDLSHIVVFSPLFSSKVWFLLFHNFVVSTKNSHFDANWLLTEK